MAKNKKPDEKKLLEDKHERLESVPDKFVSQVQRLEPKIMSEIEDLIAQLDTVKGQMVFDDRNLALIESINQRIKNIIFDEQYTKDLTGFIREFKVQSDLNNAYFNTIIDSFELKDSYQKVLQSSQRNAIRLLGEDAYTQKLIQPIQQTLESSLINKTPFKDLVDNLRFIVIGDEEVDGAMSAHVKRIAYDSFAVSDRSYTNAIATDLGLEFYRYSGASVEKDTRCFCKERVGKFFHKKEIEEWGKGKNLGICNIGDGKWAGMNTNTDEATIFYYAGGYNCKHGILPIAERSVPDEVKKRAKANGYVK